MTNLDSVLKGRDISLLTKVHIIKAVIFPVVMYVWKLDHKKGWVPQNWLFWIVVLEKTLESPLDSKEIQPVNPEYSLEGLMLMLKLKLQYFGHQMQRAVSLEKTMMLGRIEGRRRKGWQWMKCLDCITDLMDMSLSKVQEIVKDSEAWHAAIHGVAKNQMRLSKWATRKRRYEVNIC